MDNKRLVHLRKQYSRGYITAEEMRIEVVRLCQRMPAVDIKKTVGYILNLIENKGLRSFTYDVMAKLPRYYWHIPASIIGYHDIESDNLIGGLVRHSCKVAQVGRTMADPYNKSYMADDFVIAGLLHDSLKYGWSGYIPHTHDHATYAADWLKSNNLFNDRPHIRGMVRTHMGRWGKVMPRNDVEWGFHLADYMVSRGATPNS